MSLFALFHYPYSSVKVQVGKVSEYMAEKQAATNARPVQKVNAVVALQEITLFFQNRFNVKQNIFDLIQQFCLYIVHFCVSYLTHIYAQGDWKRKKN